MQLAEVRAKYDEIARIARNEAMKAYGDPNLVLKAIGVAELAHAACWQSFPGAARPHATWKWQEKIALYRQTEPKRFELALYYRSICCGLSLGRPNRSGKHLRLEFVESNPDPLQPLRKKVMPLSIQAYVQYARAIAAAELRLANPVPELIPYYSRMGFVYHAIGMGSETYDYLTKMVE